MDGRHAALLGSLGERVRELREAQALTRARLAELSGVSPRYLAELEAGSANISVSRLADVAQALGTTAAELLETDADEVRPARARSAATVIALLGLRGAGKSTIGAALGARLGRPFFELDQLVEQMAAMPLGSIFELHGERYFRRLERETLARFLADRTQAVLATGGGIVAEPASFELLRRHTLTVWLRAPARAHWDRVLAQGDRRPMADRSAAFAELKALLAAREPLYARAHLVVDTAALDVAAAVESIASAEVGA